MEDLDDMEVDAPEGGCHARLHGQRGWAETRADIRTPFLSLPFLSGAQRTAARNLGTSRVSRAWPQGPAPAPCFLPPALPPAFATQRCRCVAAPVHPACPPSTSLSLSATLALAPPVARHLLPCRTARWRRRGSRHRPATSAQHATAGGSNGGVSPRRQATFHLPPARRSRSPARGWVPAGKPGRRRRRVS